MFDSSNPASVPTVLHRAWKGEDSMGEEKQPTWPGLPLFLLFGKYYVSRYTIFRKGPINNLKEVLECSVSVYAKYSQNFVQ